jgi:DNA-binding NarL/FixJ family response regulator
MANPITLYLVDDHQLLRAGLVSVVKTFPNCEVVGEGANQRDLEAFIDNNPLPNVVLMDVGLGSDSGISITQWLTDFFPEVRVIGLTVSDELSDILEMVQAGAKGYVLKNTDQEELQRAIYKVGGGGIYYASFVAETLLKRFLHTGIPSHTNVYRAQVPMRQQVNPNVHLTRREIEILIMVAREHNTNTIAEKLNISPRTVENHRYRLTMKLGVKGAAGLAKYAINHGLLD